MWEWRTEEQKEKLIRGVTKAFESIGFKKESAIIIHETPKSNWGIEGKPASKTNL